VLHVCARDGNLQGLRLLLGAGATYTPVCNDGNADTADGVTALYTAVKHQYRDCAKELWQHLTPDLNETTAGHVTRTLALLASKRTTAMLVLPFLRDSAASTTRQLTTFRTTFHNPIACVLPSSSLSDKQLNGGGWNLLDIFTSVCLTIAVVAHFSGDLETVRTFGSIGVACKWLVCENTTS
jgi:hypothetical protein